MNCLEAREILWPPELPRLVEDDIAEAREHFEHCEACRTYFAQDRALLAAYDRARRQPAPLALRERVFEALARSRWESVSGLGPSAQRRRWGMAAAGIAVIASLSVAALSVLERTPPLVQSDAGLFAEDYLRRAVSRDHIVTSDPAEVRGFLQRELGMRLEPIQLAGLAIERAEVCLIRGRRGAMIVYRRNGAPISHYLVPSEDGHPRAPAVAEYRSGPGGVQMPVITWATPAVEQALVGEVEASELLQIASRRQSDAR